MCNRCDGGSKELTELKCNNEYCKFVYYKVVDDYEENIECPKCRKGIGILEKEAGDAE